MPACNFCKREFKNEKTLLTHLCEQARRFKNKDAKHVQLGFHIYKMFYKVIQGRANKTYDDFSSSPYYLACTKWGNYVMEIGCFDTLGYANWLIKNQIPIDKWTQDSIYTKWVADWVYIEDHYDAATRSIETMHAWAVEKQAAYNHYFKYAATPRIILDLQTAKVTGWVVFCSETGPAWLSNLQPEEIMMIWDVVNPDKWQKKFRDRPDAENDIKELCKEAKL
jgi:hypothetical protein